jgi:rhomboid protease GluP
LYPLYEWDRSRSKWASPTIVLILANIIVFIVLVVVGDPAYALLAQTGELVFGQHFYWQVFTSLFVHFDITHILWNMVGLYYFGKLNESQFSNRQFYAIYFISGLLGNLVSLIPFFVPPDVPSGGASGAIFGLVGSFVAIRRKARDLGAALLYAAVIFISSSGPGVNIYAHLFGLLGGIVLGLLFISGRKPIGYSDGSSYSM